MIFFNKPAAEAKTDKKGQARERRETEEFGRIQFSREQGESQRDQ